MPRKLARTAGIIGLLIFGLIVSCDAEAHTGGHALPQPIRSIALVATAVCAIVWWTAKLIDSAMLRYAGTVTAEVAAVGVVEVDQEALRLAVKEIVADVIAVTIQEAMDEVYRLGMVSGAEHASRPQPRLIHSREGD